MPKRPTTTAPNFGQWLALRRGDHSLEQIARRVRRYVEGVQLKVNPSLIHKIERGRVPSWPLLAAFARVYDVPMAEMTAQLIAGIEFPGASDLLGHGRTGQSDTHQEGVSDVPASDDRADREIRELRQQIEEYRALLGQVENAASTLATVIAAGEQIGTAGATQPKARRGHRAAG